MKKIFLTTATFISISLLCGGLWTCTDALNITPSGNLTMEEVLADPNKTAAWVSACYDNIPSKGWNYRGWQSTFDSCSDDGWSSFDYGQHIGESYKGLTSAAYHPLLERCDHNFCQNDNYWQGYWEQIRKCSEVIDKVDQSAASESNKSLYKAEARVIRAWFYMELVKFFGKLPVLESALDVTADFSTLKRESVYDVATRRIAVDCDAAIAATELPWRIENAANAGRVTKALAHAIKATAYLYAASPLHNEGANHWEEAYQVSRTAVNQLKANGYELYTNCTQPDVYGTGDAAAWSEFLCSFRDYPHNRDKETIWQKEGGCPTWAGQYAYILFHETGWMGCGTTPTQELMDAFETRTGEPILDLRQPYSDEKHLQPNFRPGTGYNDSDPFSCPRDPRYNATALKNGDVIQYSYGLPLTIETWEGGNLYSPQLDPNKDMVGRTGYYARKMIIPGTSMTFTPQMATHKFFRFAEIILTYAEAAAEANHLDEAKTAVDEIRDRVKMPPLPSGLSQEDLLLRIKNERRVELALEQQRYFDLRRWQKPDGNIEFLYKWATGIRVKKQLDGKFTYERINIYPTGRMGYETKDLLFPLPLNEVSILEDVTGEKWQNPGW